jgi:hypothetical protein
MTGEKVTDKHATWVPMRLTYLGDVHAFLRQGGGKVSILTGDPGEPRKVPATG